ncbi:MAG TPA: serine hydrolase [Candidatus Baltobacteraceae bacterium]|nr:serine hydrolase [Candidatus Baltobacteraceae bacterium]
MHNWRCSRLALTAFAVLLCANPASAAAPPGMDRALARIGEYAPQALQEQGAPGMVVAVTDGSRTLRIYPVGYADLAAKVPVTDRTRFGIGSLSKSMTSTALLELRDAGRFDPQRPVTAYLPWFSIHTRWRAITPHDLFTHTSGLPDGGLSTGFSAVYDLRNWMTGFAPGTHWSYSNVGYDTLGAILESLDRANYPDIMQRRVFAPLGMNDTTAVWNPRTLEDAANGYLYRADDVAVPQDPALMVSPTTHFIDPAGSVLSTGADMAAYMRFLINGGRTPSGALISPQSYSLLSSAGVTNGHELGDAQAGMYHRYGYGLAIMNVDGDKVLAHTGGVISYTGCMMVDVTRGFGVIALSNLGYAGPRPCAIVSYAIQVLRAQAQGKPLTPLPRPKDLAQVTNAADYAGTYSSQSGERFTVTASGDRLTLHRGSGVLPVYPRGEDFFWVDDPQFATFGLEFSRDRKENVTSVSSGPQWFTNERYSGERAFLYPPAWSAYAGEYETTDPDGYYWSLHVYERQGKLWADSTQLVPISGTLFHLGTDSWEPAWLRFGEPVAGKTQLLRMPGETLYRTNPF